MKQILRLILIGSILSSIFSPGAAKADGGTQVGGGGDASEARVNEIRADILNWISQGGAQGLTLPDGLTLETYQSELSSVLVPGTVIVGFVTSAEESSTSNPELRVIVDGQPKTCRGFVSVSDNRPHILCNTERFAATGEAEQFRLVHHEYAGLAGIEQNIGAASDYFVSTQLTQFLVRELVLRLAVLPVNRVSVNPESESIFGSYELASDLTVSESGSCASTLELRDMSDQFEMVESHRMWAPGRYSTHTIPKESGIRFNRHLDQCLESSAIYWSETRVYREQVMAGRQFALHIETDQFANYARTRLGRVLRRNHLLNTQTQHFDYNPRSQLMSVTETNSSYSGFGYCLYRRI